MSSSFVGEKEVFTIGSGLWGAMIYNSIMMAIYFASFGLLLAYYFELKRIEEKNAI